MKTCRMMFYSDYVPNEQLIKAVQNSSHLDKCYIGLCEKTWTNESHKTLNLNLLNNIQSHAKNSEVIFIKNSEVNPSGKTPSSMVEAFCRNIILEIAREKNYDFMFIQDTDEFLIKKDYESVINDHIPCMKNYNCDCSAIRWKNFWKSWDYILESESENVPGYPGLWANFGINLHSNIAFTKNREHSSKNKCGILQDWYLYHGSFVLTDDQVKRKITTWGHSADRNYDKWYGEKWLNWTPDTTNLHPSENPSFWTKAVPYEGELPQELIDYKL